MNRPSSTNKQALLRDAKTDDVRDLAQIWYDGWQDAHADLLPTKLAQHRTLGSFRDRLARALSDVRVAALAGELVGFSMIKDDELNQLYVASAGRGTGIAASLNADALARIKDGGFRVAWLACAIGNARAARFYEKSGWRHKGTMTSDLETPDGTFTLEVWRYEVHFSRRS
ncbi:MAG: GNAT family N-acetyltransferase [Hyphomicrobiales bacterium]